jgi:chromosome partition protein MukE
VSGFERLGDAVQDDRFVEADLLLRRGHHLGREDPDLYAFVLDAMAPLEELYERFGARLVHRTDGYFFLVPVGDRLSRRQLTAGEMLVGQALALLYLDPATLRDNGIVERSAILRRLDGLLGIEALFRALAPRRQRFDERVASEMVRTHVATALRRLAELGFIDLLDGERARLRHALMRFTDPVRPSAEPGAALTRLIRAGEVTTTDDGEGEGDEPPSVEAAPEDAMPPNEADVADDAHDAPDADEDAS